MTRSRESNAGRTAQTRTPRMPNLLLVEDDDSLRAAWVKALESYGQTVMAAGRFEEAKRYLTQHTPDAVITDVRLGAYNGLQLVLQVKATHPEVKVIVVSGFDDEVLRAEAERSGAVFMVKPIQPSQLLDQLQK
jgi:DNA-binding NtrC family response regulator